MQKQERLLSRHPHVVVATPGASLRFLEFFVLSLLFAAFAPYNAVCSCFTSCIGRLWEFISSGHSFFASLHALRMVVIDEADRMLTSGHFKELQVTCLVVSLFFSGCILVVLAFLNACDAHPRLPYTLLCYYHRHSPSWKCCLQP